jgi:3-methyladenine DNA glycosylase/8-oxoguanine DNA glycosylase
MHPSCAFSLYELLCITLVLQNAQVNRSVKMLEVMLHTFGKKVNFDNIILSSFWKPENLLESSEEYLRSLKIGYRAKSFLKVSDFFVDNPEFEFKLRNIPKSEAAKELQKIYGIGPASTWYLLFEKLHHYDAFDYVSPWELKILSMLIFGSMEKQSNEILNYANEKWGDKRMLAIHYIFEDVFWKRKNENIEWLNKLIRL